MATTGGKPTTQRARMVPRMALHTILLAMLLGGFMAPCPAQEPTTTSEAESAFSYGLETDCNSQYVWRGIVFEDHLVVQPSVWASAYGFTATVWNNHAPQNERAFGIGNELDFSLTRELSWKSLTAEAGFDYYTYPHQEDAPSTGEAGVKLSCKLGPAEFSSAHAWDVIEYRGAYFGDIAAALEHELIPHLSASAALRLGWASAQFNETYLGVRRAAMNYASVELAATIHAASAFYVRPHVEYFRTLNSALREAGRTSATNAGVALGFEW